MADQSHAASFFCGGSRNFSSFIDLFDRVFVLEVDLDTLTRRLAERPKTIENRAGVPSAKSPLLAMPSRARADHPLMFVTGDRDSRVDPMQARKMCAALQSTCASREHPILLHYRSDTGHMPGLRIDAAIDEGADVLASWLVKSASS